MYSALDIALKSAQAEAEISEDNTKEAPVPSTLLYWCQSDSPTLQSRQDLDNVRWAELLGLLQAWESLCVWSEV